MKDKKHIWYEDDYCISFHYTGGENEWQETSVALGGDTFICETYGDVLTLWLYTPLSRKKLCEPVKVKVGRKYNCSYFLETNELRLNLIPTKKEVKYILKHIPHNWNFDKFGTDLTCKVCGHNMEGMNYKVAKVNWNDLSKEGQENRLKLQKIIKGKYLNINNFYHIPDITDGITAYAPIHWFNETVYMEEINGEDDMFKTSYHAPVKHNALTEWAYDIDENGNVSYNKMDGKVVDCPYCEQLHKVFSLGYQYWPKCIKLKGFIKYKLPQKFKHIGVMIENILYDLKNCRTKDSADSGTD